MPRKTPNTNSSSRHSSRRPGGFTVIELVVMATIVAIVTAFGLIGITKARAAVRLSGAAREYASYIEKARVFSIRNHADAAAEQATIAINTDKASYDVTMDLDGDADMDTRTVTLPSGITFETVEAIAFDWRGRTVSTVDGITTPNAQVSIRLLSSDDSISVDVTGSGDVTIDSQVFDDSVPNVTLNIGDLAAGATPVPTPTPESPSASPTPTPILPIDPTDAVPTPTPILDGNGLPVPTPTPSSTPTPNPTPTSTPTPGPTPTPTPVPCTITVDQIAVLMGTQASATIKVSHSSDSSVSITATSSKPSDLQVTPAAAQTVSAGGSVTFTLKSKKSLGTYYVTFGAGCGSKTVPVVVLL
jgi:type II secretory pathway pseudopilin PulG